MRIPELLSPAGNLAKCKVAINYGADAVYLAGQKFGLRAAADNFTTEELAEAVAYAHARSAKVYVVLNGFLHDEDLVDLPEFVKYLDQINIDAVIVSDLGVIKTVQQHSSLEVHLSTQASCTNAYSAKLWKEMGVSRIVLGREVSLAEAKKIKELVDIELEMFIHGSMCMAYSGNCVISNFTQGRDSNRGGCAHSCRFEYSIDNGKSQTKAHFMSSTDLNGLGLLKQYAEAGIDSVKVEGRMKSHLYAATVSKCYRRGLDLLAAQGDLLPGQLAELEAELRKITHRTYAAANLIKKAGKETIFKEREHDQGAKYFMVGQTLGHDNDELLIEVRSSFQPGDELEILSQTGENKTIRIEQVRDLNNNQIEKTKPSTIVKVPTQHKIAEFSIIRMVP